MSERAWTPGPWQVKSDRNHRSVTSKDVDIISVTYAGDFSGRAWPDIDEADARLIAAAPDLYEALEACRQAYSTGTSDGIPLLTTINAALAKASP